MSELTKEQKERFDKLLERVGWEMTGQIIVEDFLASELALAVNHERDRIVKAINEQIKPFITSTQKPYGIVVLPHEERGIVEGLEKAKSIVEGVK